MMRWHGAIALSALALTPALALGQGRTFAPDAFEDPTARTLYGAAVRNWSSLDESILRYSARIDQRIAAAIRTPLKDRVIYRNETAVRAFWDHEYDAVVQVLATRSQYPGRSIAVREGDLAWIEDLPFDEPFEPGGDRLLFGFGGEDSEGFEPAEEEFWFAHPLAEGADSLYRFQSGDTLTLSLPGGRRLQAIQLNVIPRVADVHRISGSLWIEPETGALVRAVYRLSQQFNALRDVPQLQEEEASGSFKYVPGLFKPWTFDLTMIAVDYGLWEFKVWLPRSMRMEGEAAAGILKIPISMDVAYRIESVTIADGDGEEAADLTEDPGPEADLEDVHFETRAEAMAFIARLLSGEDVVYETMPSSERGAQGRESVLIVPQDRSSVATSDYLPPPIWENAAGFPSDEDLAEYLETLADLPAPTIEGIPWSANWGWARPDLIRYNRIEGPALGGRFEASVGGPYTFGAAGFFGFSNLQPSARIEIERATVLRRWKMGVYREMQATDARGGYLGFGNSVDAFFFGRDNGEYYRAMGADLTLRPPSGSRESFELRAYTERQVALETEAGFALFRALSRGWDFRPNVAGVDLDEMGAELRLSPWWGSDPQRAQVGLELYAHGARWRLSGADSITDYGRGSALLRMAFPLFSRWRLGLEAGGGTTWGDAPAQRAWFLGSAGTLRGYPPAVMAGTSFTRGRAELARTFADIGAASVFGDVGWAGPRADFRTDDLLYGVGVGGSFLDGLLRIDLSHGLNGVARQFRVDLYLDAIL